MNIFIGILGSLLLGSASVFGLTPVGSAELASLTPATSQRAAGPVSAPAPVTRPAASLAPFCSNLGLTNGGIQYFATNPAWTSLFFQNTTNADSKVQVYAPNQTIGVGLNALNSITVNFKTGGTMEVVSNNAGTRISGCSS